MVNTALTVADLKKMCDYQIKKGNGNKKILISNDDEGNGFHELFYAFQEVDKIFGEFPPSMPWGVDENNIGEYITLG